MYVIGHQAIRPDFDTCLELEIADQLQVGHIVRLVKKGWLPPVSTLGDVVRITGNHQASRPWHQAFPFSCATGIQFQPIAPGTERPFIAGKGKKLVPVPNKKPRRVAGLCLVEFE